MTATSVMPFMPSTYTLKVSLNRITLKIQINAISTIAPKKYPIVRATRNSLPSTFLNGKPAGASVPNSVTNTTSIGRTTITGFAFFREYPVSALPFSSSSCMKENVSLDFPARSSAFFIWEKSSFVKATSGIMIIARIA